MGAPTSQLEVEAPNLKQSEKAPSGIAAIRLSIVVTVFSETMSITETVDTLLSRDRGYIEEIILLMSPRASGETFDICRQCAAQDPRIKIVVQKNNPGIGWAYREGMQAARGNYVALMAADLETEPAAVDRMVDKIVKTGCDGVIANRWLPGGGFTNYDPLKYVLNWIFQKMFKLLFWTNLGDLTFGFKILSKEITRIHRLAGNAARDLHRDHREADQKGLTASNRSRPSGWAGKEGASVNTFFKNFRYVRMALKTLVVRS